MKRVLIVSPSFPPTSTADLHRVRASLPHFAEFGWSPYVLAIRPEDHGGLTEPELRATVPDVPVTRTRALPAGLTRLLGIGNPGLRALGHLYAAGAGLIKRESIDLVYFSTTMFPVTILGRIWKARFGTPYVVDFQDPWRTDYRGAARPRGPKAAFARTMHGMLEPLTMRKVDGVVAVSAAYVHSLVERYPWLEERECAVIPFGASARDLDVARAATWASPLFDRDDGRIHGVAVGRGGRDMAAACELLFGALRSLDAQSRGMRPVHLWFVGTDYAAGSRGKETVAPVARAFGLGSMVTESPARVPYLEGLRLLEAGHFTVILGSDDAAYSPSKVYPCLLAGRPFVAVLHASSPVVPLLQNAGTGIVATFQPGGDLISTREDLAKELARLIANAPQDVRVPSHILDSFSPRELTRRQCAVFDRALQRQSVDGVPCAG